LEKNKREKTPQKKISKGRLWLFRFIAAIVIPAFTILSLEWGLRFIGFGFSPKPIIKCSIKGQKAYCDNVKFSWLFFPPTIARPFTPFVIPTQKSENTYRIFVLGSSAAQGVPDSAYSFSRILDCLLSEQYPDINFEIINTAATAINSHVVVRIAEDCVRYKPDLFVVYMGNNEVIGPYGAGTIFAPLSGHLSFIRFEIALKGTRLGQLMTNLSQLIGQGKISKVWRGMEQFVNKQVSADDKKLQIVYQNFRGNLETIVKTAEKKKVPVILATVGNNLKDCPPFASLHRTGLTEDEQKNFDKLYKEARELDGQGQYAQAREKYLAAAAIDDQFAELQFCLGRLAFISGQYDEAKQRYIKARELDAIRFRADNQINKIIRETAQKEGSNGVYLADAMEAFDEQSPHQIPGSELFYEHVHLTFSGAYILAKTINEEIEKILPDKIKKGKLSGQENIDEQKCMQGLVFSEWDKYMVLQSLLDSYIVFPPFTNQLYHNEQVENLKQQISSLKNKLGKAALLQIASDYRSAIKKRPTDWTLHWKYGSFMRDAIKDNRTVVEEFNIVLEIVPQFYMADVLLGETWEQMGNSDKALSYFIKTIRIKPTYAPAYYDMGLIYQKKKMNKEARRCYETALRLNPEHYPSYINLGDLLAENGRVDEAIKLCRKGMEFYPNSADLHFNLACFLRKNGQKDEAKQEFEATLKINPEHKPAKNDLESILKESK
jgi:tetratricopeptide (TPR) repeat protein